MAQTYPNHGRIDGPIVMIGFGSIGQGTLPLIERHFTYDPRNVHVIEPSDEHRTFLEQRGVHFIHDGAHPDNYRAMLRSSSRTAGASASTSRSTPSSLDIMRLCRELGVLYIDTVVEPWAGHYFDLSLRPGRSHQLRAARGGAGREARQSRRADRGQLLRRQSRAWSRGCSRRRCSGSPPTPASARRAARDRAGWARLMQSLGVKGVHIAERDTQAGRDAKPLHTFVNTWSVDGFVSRELPAGRARLGHARALVPAERPPPRRGAARRRSTSTRPGLLTKVHTWTPEAGPQYGFLVTHNEAISIADYYTDRRGRRAGVPPDLPLRLPPLRPGGAVAARDARHRARCRTEAEDPRRERDPAGARTISACCVYGHARNALWYGSRLSIEETRALAPFQNATGLQVTSAVARRHGLGAGKTRDAGIVETDEMDHAFCLDDPAALSRPGRGALHRLDADLDPLARSSPRRSTRATPGSSRTCSRPRCRP